MGLNNAAKSLAGAAVAGAINHISLHTAAPDATGSNQSAAGRVAITLANDGNGNLSASNMAFAGGAASGPVTHVGFWAGAGPSGGTYYGALAIPTDGSADLAFNAAGEYTVNLVAIATSSTG